MKQGEGEPKECRELSHASPQGQDLLLKYIPTSRAPRDGTRSQRWSTFVRNHASAVLACDFFVVVTATFRVVYVFVVLEVESRRICHWNVTEHPTAEWTAQQFRMVMSGEEPHRTSFTTTTASTQTASIARSRRWA